MSARIIVGLGYGDEGKGTIVDYFCKHEGRDLVVRYNGGSQAAHNVVTDAGVHHTFSQIGSGTFQGAKTLLSRFMMVDPILLAFEASTLSPKLGRHALNDHYIDSEAPVITLFHSSANRIKEWLRGSGKHGSCGMGIGELGHDLVSNPSEVIRMGSLNDKVLCERMLIAIQKRKRNSVVMTEAQAATLPDHLKEPWQVLNDPDVPLHLADYFKKLSEHFTVLERKDVLRLLQRQNVIFEGAQGVGLDEWHGFHPYTTWSTTTQSNALHLCVEAGISMEVTGVLRSYSTRHGAGPFVTEDSSMTGISAGEHNQNNLYQNSFRVGCFDAVLTRYTAECCNSMVPLSNLAITHMDLFNGRYCFSYLSEEGTPSQLFPKYNHDLSNQERM